MAIDEVLMEAQRVPGAVPCLRFYRWERPAVTCGYFQGVRAVGKRFKDTEIVRRLTGGGLVKHGQDITFSLTLRENHPFFSVLGGPASGGQGHARDFYLKVSEALRIGLKPHFPQLEYADCKNGLSPRGRGERICFDQPACYDLLLGGKKVAGSSQRHTGGAVLYQSSLFLPSSPEEAICYALDGFRGSWKAEFEEKKLTAEEWAAAKKKEEERYASGDWRFLEASFFSKHSGQL